MRRARSTSIVATSIGMRAGNPSTIAVSPGPCDSPAVKKRSGISPALATLLPELLRARKRGGPRRADVRRHEDEQLLAMVGAQVALEQPPERRDVAEEG